MSVSQIHLMFEGRGESELIPQFDALVASLDEADDIGRDATLALIDDFLSVPESRGCTEDVLVMF